MREFLIAPVDRNNRWITDHNSAAMASRERGYHSDHELETADGLGNGSRISDDEVNMCMFEDGHIRGDVPPSPNSDYNDALTTWTYTVHQVDQGTDLQALHPDAPHFSHVAVSDYFSRKKENFKCFRWQFRLFITTNERDFITDQSRILFILSYMTEGAVELWSNTYVDEALATRDWGLWTIFMDTLARDFDDSKEPWRALEEISQLY
jgi:hypothetical protein